MHRRSQPLSSNPTSSANINLQLGDVNAPLNTFSNVARDQINYTSNYYQHHQIGLEQRLDPVIEAGYNRAGPVFRCQEGTRKEVIAEAVAWVDDLDGHPICWLSGPAGSGKSAISQTVAEEFAACGRLAGSFFFFRGAGRRSKIAHFLPTIAYQLAKSIPGTEPLIQQVLQAEPHIASLSFAYQFNKLILQPLISVMPRQHVAFVFDGLDECDDRESMAEFIQVMIDIISKTPGLPSKVLCTSRVEEHIREILESPAAESITRRLSLEDFDAGSDIRTFFQSRFDVIYGRKRRYMRNISLPWPSAADLSELVNKCEGSFIFAATLINFIDDGSFPHRKIEAALRVADGLDPLYTQVLSSASHDHHFERVVGAIMVLGKPLAITSLGRLLRLDTDEILRPLLGMQSILAIPGDDAKPVQLLHTSLGDFLTTESRSDAYFINSPTHHLAITVDCLEIVIGSVENGVIPYSEVQQYACMGWYGHLDQGLGSGNQSLLFNVLSRRLPDLAGSQSCDSWINMLLFVGERFGEVEDGIKSALDKASLYDLHDMVQVLRYLLRRVKSVRHILDEGAIVALNPEDAAYRTNRPNQEALSPCLTPERDITFMSNRHVQLQHEGLFKCEGCKKTFRRINAYNRHLGGANCRGMPLVAGDLDIAGNDMTPKFQDTPLTGSDVGGIDMQTTFNPNPLVSHGTDAGRDTLLIGENHENVSTTATVTSSVLLANDAFMHVVKCFDTLQNIMGLCGCMQSDFAVEVGFVEECWERTQGVYLYCRNQLDEKSQVSLVELFHPFPYTILPLPDGNPSSFGDGDVICSSPLQDTGGDQDKGKQQVGQPNMGNHGGSSSGGNTSREGKDHSGSEDDTSGNGNDDRGRPSGGPPSEPPGGGGGQDSQNRKLRGDFESTAICSITEKEIQRFKMRANIVLEIEITEQSAEISAKILELSIKTIPDQPFLLDHYVIEMLPGSNAENVSNARPKNRVGEANMINQTTELSGSATLSANPSAVVGGRRAIQEDILRHPIRFKYHENPGDFISSQWEFCVEDTNIRRGQLDLEPGHRLLPAATFDEPIRHGATPLGSIRELHPMTVHIACYYTKGQFQSRWLWFSQWKRTAERVGWRNFCHETVIVMPIADWPNAKKLYRLPIDVSLSDGMMEIDCTSEICNHLQDGPPGLIFSTFALNKAFVATTDFPAYTSPSRSEH